MKVVITGASGNIGTALLRLWPSTSDLLIGISRRSPDLDQPPYARAQWLACDLSDPQVADNLCNAFIEADAVIHLAWMIQPAAFEKAPQLINSTSTRNVLRAARKAKVGQLVFASSAAAYTPAQRWEPVSENWPRGGVSGSAYSMGKAFMEAQLDEFNRRYPTVTIARIRPPVVIQSDAKTQLSDWTLSPLIPRRFLQNNIIPVPLWPALRMQFIHADDIATAIYAIVTAQIGGCFNLAAQPVLDSHDLAKLIGSALLPVPRALLRTMAWLTWRTGLQPLHPGWIQLADKTSLINTQKAQTELGWQPHFNAFQALAELTKESQSAAAAASPALNTRQRKLHFGFPSHSSQKD